MYFDAKVEVLIHEEARSGANFYCTADMTAGGTGKQVTVFGRKGWKQQYLRRDKN